MNHCKGITLKGKKCKNKCKNKYCNKHSKKQKGGTGILNSPRKIGRFSVKHTTTNKRSVKFDDNTIKKVIKIPKNDCPIQQRPRLRKHQISKEEYNYDKKQGIKRTKKYDKFCPPGSYATYKTKNGYDCCAMKKYNKIKSSLNPLAKEFKI